MSHRDPRSEWKSLPVPLQTDKPVWPLAIAFILLLLLSLVHERLAGLIVMVIGWVAWLGWLWDVFGIKKEK